MMILYNLFVLTFSFCEVCDFLACLSFRLVVVALLGVKSSSLSVASVGESEDISSSFSL